MLPITEDIYNTTVEFPIEEKIQLIDKLLIDISSTNSTIDRAWIDESNRRLEAYRNGNVKLISNEDVFSKINKKYNQEM